MTLSTNDIRTTFLNFFKKNQHEEINSSPLVPQNDPTLLFTNAGMVQFKNIFTGLEKRDYVRATTSQKCVRAGGKHNDLENVGYTARHHTFFEMLGNFSFGDYFKDVAIELAWELITKEFQIPQSKLLVTVFHEDDDAYNLWKKIAGLRDSSIIRISSSDNFWSMGDTGPCGPCSEIFYDHGDKYQGGPPGSPEEDGDRFIEIWNLVFMQYNQLSVDRREALPRPSIDTGMGLERISAIMQGVHDNYDTDTLRVLVEASADIANVDLNGVHHNSNRVIADHIRSSAFLIADGVLPSNEGRGYVLRRIMRRAMRHAHIMGCRDAILHRLVPVLVNKMGSAYPELNRAETLIRETLELEENRFKQMLDRGLGLLTDETNKLGDGEALAGDIAFRLYDTYGFPLDLTQDVLRGQGRRVDLAGFNQAMEQQKADARRAWAGSGENVEDALWFELREDIGATEFLGYGLEQADGQVVALVIGGEAVKTAEADDEVLILTNQTPFYGESGGQQGDAGILYNEGVEIKIVDTQKELGDLHVHVGRITRGRVSVGETVLMTVDPERRLGLRCHHSATHLLHAALRRNLGEHITQKGSLVSPDRLRFDISHPKAFTAEEINKVSKEVNQQVRNNSAVVTRVMAPNEATDLGAMALFGEKYGEEVRVVAMGDGAEPFSLELCGGTHVSGTGDIGFFKVISESAVASGIRRIEAVAGPAALEWMENNERTLNTIARVLKVPPGQLVDRVSSLIEERRDLEGELIALRRRLATGGVGNSDHNDIEEIGAISFLSKTLKDTPAKELKSFVDTFKQQIGSGVIAICGVFDGKASLVVGVTEDLTEKFNAVDLVRLGSPLIGGKGGGGRPDMAQAGGPDVEKVEDAIASIRKALAP
ncbi:MAG: alanine--tRNA ligase [Pseudomonadota bacterium]|nr:alanine--tRNA ligase [Pseudomonadota bacterium]